MSSSNQLIHDSLATLLPRDGDLPPSALDYMKAFLVMLRQLQIYLSCCFAVLLWDYLVTAGDEIRYVWPARFTVVKLCFFINRYLTLAHMIFVMCCAFTTTLLDHCSKIYRIQVGRMRCLPWPGVTRASLLSRRGGRIGAQRRPPALAGHTPLTRSFFRFLPPSRSPLQDYVPIIIFICCNFKLAQRCSALFRNPKPVFYGLMGVIAAQAVVQAVVAFSNICELARRVLRARMAIHQCHQLIARAPPLLCVSSLKLIDAIDFIVSCGTRQTCLFHRARQAATLHPALAIRSMPSSSGSCPSSPTPCEYGMPTQTNGMPPAQERKQLSADPQRTPQYPYPLLC